LGDDCCFGGLWVDVVIAKIGANVRLIIAIFFWNEQIQIHACHNKLKQSNSSMNQQCCYGG